MDNPPHLKLRVLILDDSDLVRTTMQALLTDKGFEVFSYIDAVHCPLHRADYCHCTAAEVCADALVTDLDMPGMSGLEFIEELLRKGCKIPHLAIFSGTLDKIEPARTANLQCQIFAKPEGIPALLDWLDAVKMVLRPDRHLTQCLF